jgi:hypothetical protein
MAAYGRKFDCDCPHHQEEEAVTQMLETVPEHFDWEHVYLLGWYGPSGHPYLTTWEGDKPPIRVVVTGPEGITQFGPPLWGYLTNVKVPNPLQIEPIHVDDCQLHFVQPGEDRLAKARELAGVGAIGWYIEEGFQRRPAGEVMVINIPRPTPE